MESSADGRLAIENDDWLHHPPTPGFTTRLDENGRVELTQDDCPEHRAVSRKEKASEKM
jgi:hypothetical protein